MTWYKKVGRSSLYQGIRSLINDLWPRSSKCQRLSTWGCHIKMEHSSILLLLLLFFFILPLKLLVQTQSPNNAVGWYRYPPGEHSPTHVPLIFPGSTSRSQRHGVLQWHRHDPRKPDQERPGELRLWGHERGGSASPTHLYHPYSMLVPFLAPLLCDLCDNVVVLGWMIRFEIVSVLHLCSAPSQEKVCCQYQMGAI